MKRPAKKKPLERDWFESGGKGDDDFVAPKKRPAKKKPSPLRWVDSVRVVSQAWYSLRCGHEILGPVVRDVSRLPNKMRCHECALARRSKK